MNIALARIGRVLPALILTLTQVVPAHSEPNRPEGLEDRAAAIFRPSQIAQALLNPAGTYLAVVRREDANESVIVSSVSRNEHIEVFNTKVLETKEKTVHTVRWIDDRTLAVVVRELRKGIADLIDTRRSEKVFILILPDDLKAGQIDRRSIRSYGTLVSALPLDAEHFLFAKSGRISRVYRMDVRGLDKMGEPHKKTDPIDGGQYRRANEVAKLDGYATLWLADKDGAVRAAMAIDTERMLKFWYRGATDTDWIVLQQWDLKELEKEGDSKEEVETEDDGIFIPLALSEGEQEFLIVSNQGRDKRALYRYSFKDDKRELFYEDPSAEIVNVFFDYNNSDILSVALFERGEVRFHYFGDRYQDVQRTMEARYPNLRVGITSIDLQKQIFSLLLYGPAEPGKLFLYDRTTNQPRFVDSSAPWLKSIPLGSVHVGKVKSHDLKIEYFLTMPHGVNKPPLIVMPHGGPFGVTDSSYFNPVVQYLANRGYAVLQVNHRGSGGYGKAFLEAGKGEFGEKILDDIEAAVSEVLERGEVHPTLRAVVGGSYGGYAALMLAIRNPKEYACVVALAAVTDVPLLFNSSPSASNGGNMEFFREYIGDPDTDYEEMKSISPVYHVSAIQSPLLIAHGDKDKVVDIEHAYRLKVMLDAYQKEYELEIIEGEGHGFHDSTTAAKFYQRLANFLDQHIQR